MITIDKIIQVRLDLEDMEILQEEFNTELTDYWACYSDIQESNKVKEFVTGEQLDALKFGQADYIAFRLDN